jgi:metal-sulfur cluster biosynthetic enzyme
MTAVLAARVDDVMDDVIAALGTVRDPELDTPITELQFVSAVRVTGGDVEVDLRLPTYFCAPNFVYLMMADAYDAVRELPWVRTIRLQLLDHFVSDALNAGIARHAGFAESFPGLADGELDELRRSFQRKAHEASQERLARVVMKHGTDYEALGSARLGDAPGCRELEQVQARRRDLGLPAGPDAPLLIDADGAPIATGDIRVQLRLARMARLNIEGNSHFCRGLLAARYESLDTELTTSTATGVVTRSYNGSAVG